MKRKKEIEQKAFEFAMQHGFNAPSYEAGAAWADKTMIEKACEFLERHPQMEYDGMSSFIKAFRKAMEN